jgi:isoprenylcysteine carboxyl methyltransferase (ICMT) family protein YpbQ
VTPSSQPEAQPAGNANKRLLAALFTAYILALVIFCVIQHKTLFSWPAGIVTGNLIASAIWAPLAVIHLDRLAIKHHNAHLALLHKQHAEHLALIKRQHQELKDHVTRVVTAQARLPAEGTGTEMA